MLDPTESHHLITVRRIRVSESVEVLDGKGGIYQCTLGEAHAKGAILQVHSQTTIAKIWPDTILLQALIRNKPMEWIIQKATELGVGQIIPLITAHSEIQIREKKKSSRKNKWLQIAIEACKQCGNPFLPIIEEPTRVKSIEQAVLEKSLCLFGGIESEQLGLGEKIREEIGSHTILPRIVIAIGPEGDFSSEEYQYLKNSGFHSVSLGPLVLRAETAAIAALSIINDSCPSLNSRNLYR